jgi:hypothetical protein
LKNALITVLQRSFVRSAADASHRNRRVSFKSDVQESLKLLDTKIIIVWKDYHHKHKSRNNNNDVSNRTRSKADYTQQHIGSRTRSKAHNVNENNLRSSALKNHYTHQHIGSRTRSKANNINENNLRSSFLKNHNSIAYHCVREAIAARIMRLAYIKSEENVSDVLAKSFDIEKFYYLMKRYLFRSPEKDN